MGTLGIMFLVHSIWSSCTFHAHFEKIKKNSQFENLNDAYKIHSHFGQHQESGPLARSNTGSP